MSEEDLFNAELSTEMKEWLDEVAATCLAHMRYMQEVENEDPMALTVDDFGLREIERAYLSLYSIYKKGMLPHNDKTN